MYVHQKDGKALPENLKTRKMLFSPPLKMKCLSLFPSHLLFSLLLFMPQMFKKAVVTTNGMKKNFGNDKETDCSHVVKYVFFHYSMTFIV
jgi:hypothetical protein